MPLAFLLFHFAAFLHHTSYITSEISFIYFPQAPTLLHSKNKGTPLSAHKQNDKINMQ